MLEQLILSGWEGAGSGVAVLEKAMAGASGEVTDSVRAVVDARNMDHHDAVQKFQSHCGTLIKHFYSVCITNLDILG